MKSKVLIALLLAGSIVTLPGCNGMSFTRNENFEGVNEIRITTVDADVIIRENAENAVKFSLDSFQTNPATLDGDTLILDVPYQLTGLNFGKNEPLYVYVPESGCPDVTVETETGSVSVTDVEIADLSIQTESGDITITGISGFGTAATATGTLSIEAATDTNGFYEGHIGDADSSHSLAVYTESGDVTIE